MRVGRLQGLRAAAACVGALLLVAVAIPMRAFAAEAAADAAPAPAARKILPKPFSLQSKVISAVEANGLAQLGAMGLTEYVVKHVPGVDAARYGSFDSSIVVTVNGGTLDPGMLAHIRKLVAERVEKNGFSITTPDTAQAGIASVLSPFRTPTGAVTWELLLVVFDRAKYQSLESGAANRGGLDSVFQSAVRGIVVHFFPATDLDLVNGLNNPTTLDALRIMYDKAFSQFMQPMSAPTAGHPLGAAR